MNKFTVCAGVALASLVLASTASAQTTQKADDYMSQSDSSGQKVVFKDDPLTASPLSGTGDAMVLRPRVARMGLIRPRVQFIQEMLKSVESL
jgi:hypothetical protein